MRRIHVIASVVALLAMATTVFARELRVRSFHADIDLHEDASMDVTETITAQFVGQWNGLYRRIPVGYDVPGVGKWDVRLSFLGAEDDAGSALRTQTSREGDDLMLKIWVPGAVDATRTIVLHYRVRNVIRRFDGLDELYWNVTGNQWDVGIDAASATLRLPPGARSDRVKTTSYTGLYMSQATTAELTTPDERTLHFVTAEPLRHRQGLTIVVGIPAEIMATPTWTTRATWMLADNAAALVPLLLGAFFLGAWFLAGRDNFGDRIVVPDWQTPAGLRPVEVGVVADGAVDHRDVAATIVDLAVRGHLRIEEAKEQDGEKDFRLVGRSNPGDPLRPFEHQFLEDLFEKRVKRSVLLSSLEHEFHTQVAKFRRAVEKDVVRKGLFRAPPSSVRAGWAVAAVLLAVGAVLFGCANASAAYLVASAVSLPVAILCAWHMPRRTRRGLDAWARVRGMEQYLRTAERGRMENVSLEQIEALLPYAMALGMGTAWSRVFAPRFQRAPSWYDGRSDGVTLARFASTFHTSTANTMCTGPRSQGGAGGGFSGYSGGSGFSGGGSGGGFGGGGGGGF